MALISELKISKIDQEQNMKTHHLTDEQIQSAIDAACRETHAKHHIDIGTNLVLDMKAMPGTWKNEAHARRDLLKSALERLPESPPPVVDGKTPGQVNHDAVANGDYETYKKWSEISERGKCDIERGASAVLAAFGQPNLDAATRHDGQPADQPLLQPEPEVFVNGAGNPVSPPVPAWQPAVGDVVRLKSGGPVMTVAMISLMPGNDVRCVYITDEAKVCIVPTACLTPAKEAQP
jgi:hypothetical protein